MGWGIGLTDWGVGAGWWWWGTNRGRRRTVLVATQQITHVSAVVCVAERHDRTMAVRPGVRETESDGERLLWFAVRRLGETEGKFLCTVYL